MVKNPIRAKRLVRGKRVSTRLIIPLELVWVLSYLRITVTWLGRLTGTGDSRGRAQCLVPSRLSVI